VQAAKKDKGKEKEEKAAAGKIGPREPEKKNGQPSPEIPGFGSEN
jgi:hypothetical protein